MNLQNKREGANTLKFIRYLIFSILIWVYPHLLSAQSDSVPTVDSTNIEIDSLVEESILDKKTQRKNNRAEKNGIIKQLRDNRYPNPTRAAFLSLALPGAGQFYNKKYWKIPIVYAGIGGLTWLAIDQQQEYVKFREYYILKVQGEEIAPDGANLMNVNANTLKGYRNRLDKRRQQAYAGILAFWVLGAIDAFVDAHLITFDVSEDLTLQLAPSLIPYSYASNTNLGLQFTFAIRPKTNIQPMAFFEK